MSGEAVEPAVSSEVARWDRASSELTRLQHMQIERCQAFIARDGDAGLLKVIGPVHDPLTVLHGKRGLVCQDHGVFYFHDFCDK